MRETPNSYLSACLVMVGIHALTISRNAPILSLRRSSLGRYETLLRPGRKPTHVHIMNRTCPYGRECLHSLMWKHCYSMSNTGKTSLTFLLNIPPVGAINTKVAPPLFHFSHEQQQRLQSSMKDNLLSGSIALLVVHRFHVLQ